jgi:hypothetical protein
MMRSPALAIAWEFWARNRWGLSAILALLLTGGVLCHTLAAEAVRQPVRVLSPILMTFSAIYLFSVFIYAEVREGAKGTGFPPRMFTLPLRTSALVAWPMLYGVAAMFLLWGAASVLVWRPVEDEMGWWPGFMLAAGVAWFQALSWTLVSSPLPRLIVAVLIIPALVLAVTSLYLLPGVAPFIASLGKTQREQVPNFLMLTFGALIPLAYLFALLGVARNRRGAGLGVAWLGSQVAKGLSRLLARPAAPGVVAGPRRPGPFASAARAQLWFEWSRKGLILPFFAGAFLLFLIAVVAPFIRLDADDFLKLAAAAVGLPLFLAFFVGYGLGKANFWARDLQLAPFQGTRPLTSVSLVVAKLKMTALSALTTWALVLVLLPLWVVLSENRGHAVLWWELFHRVYGADVWAILPLALAGVLAWTWLQLMAGLTLCLTGRPWVVNAAVVVCLGAVAGLTWVIVWTASHPEHYDTVVTVLWALAAVAAVVKLAGAGLALWAMRRRGLLEGRLAAVLIGVWVLAAGCLVSLAYLILPARHLPVHLIAVGLALALPLTRLLAAPLALAWNRHR